MYHPKGIIDTTNTASFLSKRDRFLKRVCTQRSRRFGLALSAVSVLEQRAEEVEVIDVHELRKARPKLGFGRSETTYSGGTGALGRTHLRKGDGL